MSSNYDDSLFEFSKQFNFITSVIMTSIGLLGNSLSIYIMSRPKLRDITIFRYLMVAMVNDSLVLGTMWISTLPYIFLSDSLSCKISTYFAYLFQSFSGWILVVSLTDRLISVKYPTKFKFRNVFKYQSLIFITIFTIICLLYVPFSLYFDMYESSNQTSCLTADDQTNFYLNVCSFLIGILFPFILMILLAALIGYQLIKNKRRFNNTKSLYKEKRLITLTVVISIVFLITNLLFYIQWLINQNVYLNGTKFLIYSLSNQLTYFYNTIGFFLCMMSNSVFRQQFYSIFRKEKPKVANNKMTNIAASSTAPQG